MEIHLTQALVRDFTLSDAPSLARHANNRKVWLQLRDGFPHPYTVGDAEAFIAKVLAPPGPPTIFAIEIEGEAAGAIGYFPRTDVERISAEMGYWIAEPFWGRGIATEAIRALTAWAIETHSLLRVYALPYANNPASCRALQKAGFECEGRLRSSAIKDGKVLDQFLYAYVVKQAG